MDDAVARYRAGATAVSARCGWACSTAGGVSGAAGPLMAALFALGVMSVGWMVVIAALIALEKMAPARVAANRAVAAFLLALGLAVASCRRGFRG